VNSCVSCVVTTSVFYRFMVVFLVLSSLEFSIEIFLVTYAIETLINEWDSQGTEIIKGVNSLGC